MSSFEIAIVTPEGPAFIGQCSQALIPGSEGMFGVLARHMNLISSITPGLVTIEDNSAQSIKVVVSDGIAEINEGSLTLLVEHAVLANDIDLKAVEMELEQAKHRLEKAELETLKKDLTTKVLFLEAMIEAKLQAF